MIATCIYCCLIKYQAKAKRLLPYHSTNNNLKFYISKCIVNMESNDELKEIDIKNCTCYYFDDVMKIVDFNLNNFLIYEKYTKIFWFIRFNTKL